MVKVKDILREIEHYAPLPLQEGFDNAGVQVGDVNQHATGVLLCLDVTEYGAPPHGGLAYGLDRFVSLFAGLDSIRDCIAFPKNNSGRDVMLDAPGVLDPAQLDELNLIVDIKK